MAPAHEPELVSVPTDGVHLRGGLAVPHGARGVVLFVTHGGGDVESRNRPTDRLLADGLHGAGLATLLIDLVTADESLRDVRTAEIRFAVELLARRVVGIVDWLARDERTRGLRIGVFGTSIGAAAALVAAAERTGAIAAVVSRGGRPDLAGVRLAQILAPTLLIVGGHDDEGIDLNQRALALLGGDKQIRIVSRAGHLFQEPGALDEVARLARGWFESYLAAPIEMQLPTGEPVHGP